MLLDDWVYLVNECDTECDATLCVVSCGKCNAPAHNTNS